MADDLLKPEEIEALLKAAGGPSPGQPGGATAGGGDPVNQPQGAARSAVQKPATKPKSPTERLLEQAEAGLAAAIAPDLHSPTGIPQELG